MTAIGPEKVVGTVAVIWVALSGMKPAVTPLNVTPVTPVNPVPLMTTEVPTAPDVGLNEVMCGSTVKDAPVVAVPPAVVTAIAPVAAPAGTVAVILPEFSTVKVAGVRLNVTAVAPVNPPPLIVTVDPMMPDDGVKLAIDGSTVNVPDDFATPPEVVTLILPVVAPVGTVAVIFFADPTEKAAVVVPNLTDLTT